MAKDRRAGRHTREEDSNRKSTQYSNPSFGNIGARIHSH